MARTKTDSELNFVYRPRSQAQKDAEELWKRSRILFFVGPAGTGKSVCSLGLALREALTNKDGPPKKLWLSRPHVSCGEDLGYMPGTMQEKLAVWMGSFGDCFDVLSGEKWSKLEKAVEIETISVGMLRGRSLRNGTLIIEEGQLLSYEQLVCAVTRLGENARIIINGDPDQSDRYSAKDSPLMEVARKLDRLDQVALLKFPASGQLRDPLISDILSLL